MQHELPETIANRLQQFIDTGSASLAYAAIERALDELSTNEELPDVYERLASYRGVIKGWTFEEMLADRRQGLE